MKKLIPGIVAACWLLAAGCNSEPAVTAPLEPSPAPSPDANALHLQLTDLERLDLRYRKALRESFYEGVCLGLWFDRTKPGQRAVEVERQAYEASVTKTVVGEVGD